MGIEKTLLRLGTDLAPKLSSHAVRTAIQEWNRLVLRGDTERARSRIKLEFLKNRQLAKLLYQKHRDDMGDDVRAIFEEMIEEGPDGG